MYISIKCGMMYNYSLNFIGDNLFSFKIKKNF